MKLDFLHTKKFRHGSVSVALTVVIIAAVILVNAIFTALSQKFLWYLDMTAERIYTLSDDAKDLLKKVDPEREVTIMFCSEKDVLEANTLYRYPLYTALEMADGFKNIKIRYVDVFTNPSAVTRFKETSGQNINSQSVIVYSGTGDESDPRVESRVYSLTNLYKTDTTGQSYTGYDGEQRLVSAILAVTQAELPVVCLTANHGESDALTADPALLTLLYETGYKIQSIDLTTEDVPDDCRLMVIYNPQSDFIEMGAVSEISKIERFLDDNNALMVFLNYETPTLPNLEEYLAEWGVTVSRSGEANYLVKDADHSYTVDGYTNVARYVQDAGLGASITKPLWNGKNRPKDVVFPYATALGVADGYELIKDTDNDYWFYNYYKNGVDRDRYELFTSYDSATAKAGEANVDGGAPFTYMTVTRETKSVDNRETYADVLVCASTAFATQGALDSSYGNHAVLTYACSVLGRAYASVSLNCKYFTDFEIKTITAKAAKQYTMVLTFVPMGLIFAAGVYVMVRRKYA